MTGRNFPKLRTKLKTQFPRPKIRLEAEMQAPPKTNNYAIVGAAFDYLYRFSIEAHLSQSPEVDLAVSETVAEKVYNRYKEEYKEKPKKQGPVDSLDSELEMAAAASKYMLDINRYNQWKAAEEAITDAISEVENFRKTKEISRGLIHACIVLAKVDLIARSGRIDDEFDNVKPDDINDLENLLSIVPDRMLNPQNRIVLNPVFPVSGIGADGDLILDDMLIDIKTTKNLKIDRAMLNQLICYYTGALQAEMFNSDHPLKKPGIYFARHGYLWTIDTQEMGATEDFLDFGEWLRNYIDTRDPMKKESPDL